MSEVSTESGLTHWLPQQCSAHALSCPAHCLALSLQPALVLTPPLPAITLARIHDSILVLHVVIYLHVLFAAQKSHPCGSHTAPSSKALEQYYLAKGNNDKGCETTSEGAGPAPEPLRLWGSQRTDVPTNF